MSRSRTTPVWAGVAAILVALSIWYISSPAHRHRERSLVDPAKQAADRIEAAKIAKELRKCRRIRIWYLTRKSKPVEIKVGDSTFWRILVPVTRLLHDGSAITGEPLYAYAAQYTIQFFISPDTAYEVALNYKADYVTVEDKVRVRRQGGKDVEERLDSIMVPVHRPPSSFTTDMMNILSGD